MITFHSHGSILIFILSLYTPFLSLATDTITLTQQLTMNQTLVSPGNVFELGFSDINGDRRLYVGIWYKQIEPRTYVWIANRDNPVNSSSGKLKIGENGNIVLVDEAGITVWSSNRSEVVNNTVAQLLDSGNFVLRRENDENPENYIWQSFDYPTDTMLPEMKIGWDRKTGMNRFLTSWKTTGDPASGDHYFKLITDGLPELVQLEKETITCRIGSWNGKTVTGVPEMKGAKIIQFRFQVTSDEIYYSFQMVNNSVYSRLVIDSFGNIQRYVWGATQNWSLYWVAPRDICDYYGKCGPFGVCVPDDPSMNCKCLKGFRPRNQEAWDDLRDGSDGCVWSSKLDCGSDGFLPLKNMKLPESSKAFVDEKMNLSECGERCKKNCSCVAYANMYISDGGSGCVIWTVDLMDMRQFSESDNGGQVLYVRVAASDLDQSPTVTSFRNGSNNGHQLVKIIAITVASCAGLIILVIVLYMKRKSRRWVKKFKIHRKGPQDRTDFLFLNYGINVPSKRDYYGQTIMEELELSLFDFTTLAMATNNFSNTNKLGEGGFGCVYKGILNEREIVAIKRLSRVSDQGIEELINEVRLIAKLQHKNLVRLLGCCIEVEEKLLVYEFMENKSLNTFLFEKEKNLKLNWQLRFDIICGISRGLLYLHQDSRFKIIHRDLKVSNILLDKKMNPKISDFGMARIFGNDQTKAKTKKVVGTYGYMSPEYAMYGHFSTKSDVFSFGVLVIEIVSGQKNSGSSCTIDELSLLAHAWTLWKEGKASELVDNSISADVLEEEALRCIQIGLLCVQELPEDRPSMSNVVLMLSSESTQPPQPKYPGFFMGKRHNKTESSSIYDESMTANNVTITILDGR